jgi:hypothetical protein
MSWTHADLEAIAVLVSQRTGLSFVNRQASAELGIRRAMSRFGIRDFVHYAEQLATQ